MNFKNELTPKEIEYLLDGKITQKNPLYLIIYAKKYVLCAEMYKKTNIRIIIMILERFYYMKNKVI